MRVNTKQGGASLFEKPFLTKEDLVEKKIKSIKDYGDIRELLVQATLEKKKKIQGENSLLNIERGYIHEDDLIGLTLEEENLIDKFVETIPLNKIRDSNIISLIDYNSNFLASYSNGFFNESK